MKKHIVICVLTVVLSSVLWSCDEVITNSTQGAKLTNGLNGLFAEQLKQATQKFTLMMAQKSFSVDLKLAQVP